MGANFDSFPPNCHPELDSGSFRLRKKFMEANCIEK